MSAEWKALMALAEDDSLPATTSFLPLGLGPGGEFEDVFRSPPSDPLLQQRHVRQAQQPQQQPDPAPWGELQGTGHPGAAAARHTRARHAMETSVQFAAGSLGEEAPAQAGGVQGALGLDAESAEQRSGASAAHALPGDWYRDMAREQQQQQQQQQQRWQHQQQELWEQELAERQHWQQQQQQPQQEQHWPPPLQQQQQQQGQWQQAPAQVQQAASRQREQEQPPPAAYPAPQTRTTESSTRHTGPASPGEQAQAQAQADMRAWQAGGYGYAGDPKSGRLPGPGPASRSQQSTGAAGYLGKGEPAPPDGPRAIVQATVLAAGAEEAADMDKWRAALLHQERLNSELLRRVVALQEALQDTERRQATHEEREQDAKEQVKLAESKVQQREAQMVALQRHADAASHELRSCQQELQRERDKVDAGRDEAVDLQGQVQELNKQLAAANKKIEYLGEGERRTQSALLQLRKEHQEMHEYCQRCQVDLVELRQRLVEAEGAAGQQAAAAAHALAEGGGAVAQLHALRSRIADLEARNSQLENARNSQQADARARGQAAARIDFGSAHSPPQRVPPYTSELYDLPAQASGSRWGGQGGAGPGPAPGSVGRIAAAQGSAAGVPASKSESMKSLLYSQQGQGPASPDPARRQQQQGTYELPSFQDYQLSPRHDMQPGTGDRYRTTAWAEPGTGPGPSSAAWAPSNPPLAAAARPAPASDPYDMRGLGLEYEASEQQYGRGAASPGPPAPGGLAVPGLSRQSALAIASNHEYLRRSIEERLAALQTSEDVIRSRLGANGAPAAAVQQHPRPPLPRSDASYPPWQAPQAAENWAGVGAAGEGSDRDRAQPQGSGGGLDPQPWARGQERMWSAPAYGAGDGGSVAVNQARSPSAPGKDLPYGTDLSTKDMLDRCKVLDDGLVSLCWEKSQLEAELSKLPAGSGRNIKERRRKAEVEQRLEALGREISGVKSQLKRLTGK